MSWRRTSFALGLGLAVLVGPAPAQDDSPGFIGRQIENALSGPGREVRVRGFEGALSGRATMAELTIADADGVWLTMEGAVLDWTRAALLRGRLSVQELSAEEIVVARAPLPAPDDPTLPAPPPAEASGFALPDLPVAVQVGDISIDRLALGAPILGEAADFTLSGAVRLEDGELETALQLARLGGPEDRIALDVAFDNETRVLALDLTLREGEGGLASTLLGIPGAPSLALDIDGTGPLDDYTAVIDLSTEGVQRIAGEVTLRGVEAGGLRFAADIGGDITPVLAPELSDFFGPDVALRAAGLRAEDGALTLETLDISARSLDLEGSAALEPGGLPLRFDLSGQLADPEGGPVRLPGGGEAPVTLGQASLTASFDRAEGDAWVLDLAAEQIDAPGLDIGALTLSGGGEIVLEDGAPRVTAGLAYGAQGIAPADPALAQAVGDSIRGQANLAWEQGAPLTLTGLTIGGADYGLSVGGAATFADRTLVLDGVAELRADDLARFSGVVGRDLTGRTEARIAGQGDVLGGVFDITLDLEGEGLSIGEETVDRFLDGPVTLSTSVRRSTEGTVLDRFTLDSTGVAAQASGDVGGGTGDLELEVSLKDVGLLRPDLSGALTVTGQAAEERAGLWDVDVALDGPYGLVGSVAGLVAADAQAGRTDVALDLSLPDLSPVVEGIPGGVAVQGQAAQGDAGLWNVDLTVDAAEDSRAAIVGVIGGGQSNVDLAVEVPRLDTFVDGLPGGVSVEGTAAEATGGAWDVDLSVDAAENSRVTVDGRVGGGLGNVALTVQVPDVAAFVPGVPGSVSIEGTAEEGTDGLWDVALDSRLPYAATARVEGRAGAANSDLSYSLRLPDIGALAPGLAGALAATGTARQDDAGRWEIAADATGPYGARAAVTAGLGGPALPEARAEISVRDLSPLVPVLRGGLEANVRADQQEGGAWSVDLDAQGPFRSVLSAEGTVGGGDTNATLSLAVPDMAPLAEQLSGPLRVDATASQAAGAPIRVTLDADAPLGITADASGQVGMGQGDLSFSARLPDLGSVATGLSGAVAIEGTAREQAQAWALDLQSRGPGPAAFAVTGTIAPQNANDLSIQGDLPLALLNAVLAPIRIEGDAQADLTLRGAPSLEALSGTVSTSGTRLIIPTIGQGLQDMNVTAQIGGGQMTLDASAASFYGGGLTAAGSIQLAQPFVADISGDISGFVVEDPSLVRSTVDGDLSVTGPLRGTGGLISGDIDIGRTELRIPSGGVAFSNAIPLMQHVDEPAEVFATRERAGLINAAREARGGTRGRTILGLDLDIDMPNQIFLRGRGLDAELGGGFEIRGTTRVPQPIGAIEVIRGRLDILGKRLELEEDGRITLGGDLVPFLDLVATSDDLDDFTILIAIQGPVDDPQFTFSSAPPLPEDEVLAQFFFGQGIANLSPLQTVQLANSIARLTGRGGIGTGLVSGLREGLGVDDFNIVTDDAGDAALQIGTYLTDNIYTDVTTSSSGLSEVNINIDVTSDWTVKGSADSEGETTLGIFFQRDY